MEDVDLSHVHLHTLPFSTTWTIRTFDLAVLRFIPFLVAFMTITGVIILPTQTMHYHKGNLSELPYICIVRFPKMGNSMTLNMTGCDNYQRNFMKISLTIRSRDCDNAWKEQVRMSLASKTKVSPIYWSFIL